MVSKGLTEGAARVRGGVFRVFWGVIPGRPKGEPGIHRAASDEETWIPGSRCARPGMTKVPYFAFCIFVTV